MPHKALPQWHWDSHKEEALIEDVAFLRQRGASMEAIAKRFGVTLEAMEKRLRRAEARGIGRSTSQ